VKAPSVVNRPATVPHRRSCSRLVALRASPLVWQSHRNPQPPPVKSHVVGQHPRPVGRAPGSAVATWRLVRSDEL